MDTTNNSNRKLDPNTSFELDNVSSDTSYHGQIQTKLTVQIKTIMHKIYTLLLPHIIIYKQYDKEVKLMHY